MTPYAAFVLLRTTVRAVIGILGMGTFALGLGSNLTSCSSARVYADVDKTAQFGQYKTFALVDNDNKPLPGSGKHSPQIIEANLEHSIVDAMKAQGYSVDERLPDLLVRYTITVDTKTQVVSRPVYAVRPVVGVTGVFRPHYYLYRQPMYLGNNVHMVKHKEGTLVVDVIDRKTNTVIWHGWSEEPVAAGSVGTTLTNTVTALFQQYPTQQQ